MDFIVNYLDILMHLDRHLDVIIKQYGSLTYLILFMIIFCETGLVVTPFLPGDSLLFVAGTFAARGGLEMAWIVVFLSIAAIAGDTINYWIGHSLGPRLVGKGNPRLIRKEHLDRTHRFYEKYGGKTILLARFVPIIRTFAPFVAGIGSMTYWRFLMYNVAGGSLWIVVMAFGGFYFGNIPVVKENFTLVILAIIIISLIPAVIEAFRQGNYSLKS